jgi:hypothetical protein
LLAFVQQESCRQCLCAFSCAASFTPHVPRFCLVFWNQFECGSGSALSFLFYLRMFPWCFFDLVFFGISLVWDSITHSLLFSLVHVPLRFFDLVFWNQFRVGSGSALPFPFLTWVLILCFLIQFVWGRDLRSPLPFPHLHVPWVFLILCFGQFSVGSGSARSLSFSSLARVQGFFLCFWNGLVWRSGSALPFLFLTCACSLGLILCFLESV